MVQESTRLSQVEILGIKNRRKRQRRADERQQKIAAKKNRIFSVRLVLRIALVGAVAIGGMVALQYLHVYF